MSYLFPTINHLDDVRPAIEGRNEFIIAERDWGFVVNYIVATVDTFPSVNTVSLTNGNAISSPIFETKDDHLAAIRRECRGLIFCKKTERIVRRPLTKFFNISEREETQIHQLNFNAPHRVYTKLDGSMIVPFEVDHGSGQIRWGTKMGLSEVALKAEIFVAKNPRYQAFAKWCIAHDISPIFEYTAPTNRIVVKYDQENLTLLAARHMITGEYLDICF